VAVVEELKNQQAFVDCLPTEPARNLAMGMRGDQSWAADARGWAAVSISLCQLFSCRVPCKKEPGTLMNTPQLPQGNTKPEFSKRKIWKSIFMAV
jgi:hypothetical protein